MKERPIIFNTENVKAILEGRKTQTRRVIKHPSVPNSDIVSFQEFRYCPEPESKEFDPAEGYYALMKCNANQDRETIYFRCPYAQVGDRLWVRETGVWDSDKRFVAYKANMPDHKAKWQASIFMPRWASRITLEITDIRVERLQEIRYEDILAEGWDVKTSKPFTNRTAGEDAFDWFKQLWASLNAKYPWESNPWVWVITFKRV